MPPSAQIRQSLLGLPSLSLRRGRLKEYLEHTPIEVAAQTLDALCEAGERGEVGAREVLFPLVLMIVDAPTGELWPALRSEACGQALLSLARLLQFEAPDLASDASEADCPVPDYGGGRELTLGERRSIARRSPRGRIECLLLDPHPMVIEELLRNPRLTEDDLVRLASRRPARISVLTALLRAPRWLTSERIRLSVLFNPGAPTCITVPLTALCSRQHLKQIVDSPQIPAPVRAVALERMERLPPLQPSDERSVH